MEEKLFSAQHRQAVVANAGRCSLSLWRHTWPSQFARHVGARATQESWRRKRLLIGRITNTSSWSCVQCLYFSMELSPSQKKNITSYLKRLSSDAFAMRQWAIKSKAGGQTIKNKLVLAGIEGSQPLFCDMWCVNFTASKYPQNKDIKTTKINPQSYKALCTKKGQPQKRTLFARLICWDTSPRVQAAQQKVQIQIQKKRIPCE